MDEDEYSNFFSADSDIFPVCSAENVTVNDIRDAYNYAEQLERDHIDIIAFSQPTKAASDLIDKLDIKIKIISPFDYKDGKPLEQLLKVSESEIDREILRTYERKRKSLKQLRSEIKLFSKVRALRYLSIGGVLMIFSMFMRYSMYYRIVAIIAISAGSTSYMFEEIKKRLQNERNTGET